MDTIPRGGPPVPHGTRSADLVGRRPYGIAFLAILVIGIFARTWQYQQVPPGINLDEASIGVDAYDLLRFGVDRNGVSFPTHFISFGQEQNTLYGYTLIPFIALLGLKTAVVRLPMLLAGILSMPLVFLLAAHGFGRRVGLLSMFFLAISPWHVLLSRYGLDVNFFPFIFTAGFFCLVLAPEDNRMFPVACCLFALCFYSYGPSYFVVPAVLLASLWLLGRDGRVARSYLVAGLVLLAVLAIPCLVFIVINSFGLGSVHIGPLTIPRLPVPARFLSTTDEMQSNLGPLLVGNLLTLVRLLLSQTDGLIYNVDPAYGYFYLATFPLAVLGLLVLVRRRRSSHAVDAPLVLVWLGASIVFGILEQVNVNRLNIVFIPLLICTAICVDWLSNQARASLVAAILCLIVAFVAFTIEYHGETYREAAAAKFRPGLLSAIQFASRQGRGAVCVTDEPDFPYIYVLFVEKLNPSTYLPTMEYVDVPGPSRHVRSLDRYTFGKGFCPLAPIPTYVLKVGEIPPRLGNRYSYKFFDNYVVYYAQTQ
jgi:4-amino-4-deoxy-L-arabinose transferase-like glycosyltransferase